LIIEPKGTVKINRMRKTVDKAGNEGAKKDIKIYVQKIGCEEVIYC